MNQLTHDKSAKILHITGQQDLLKAHIKAVRCIRGIYFHTCCKCTNAGYAYRKCDVNGSWVFVDHWNKTWSNYTECLRFLQPSDEERRVSNILTPLMVDIHDTLVRKWSPCLHMERLEL